jgi:hypothetical protein
MYRRNSNSGHEIEWDPEDEDAAAQAMVDTDGTGVSVVSEARSGRAADLGDDEATARQVRERYQAIVAEKQENSTDTQTTDTTQ